MRNAPAATAGPISPIPYTHANPRLNRQVEGLRLTVSQLAGRVGTTPRTLHRRFASCLGVTPSEFMARERVRRAKDLLETTALAVDEIGLRVGFHDASAFRRAFKREADVTPSAYRRRFAP